MFLLFSMLLVVDTTCAFSILPISSSDRSVFSNSWVISSDKLFFAEENSSGIEDEESSNDLKLKTKSVYERLGFDEDKVALGVDPSEVLQWLGK